jgi:hypothetical protein
MVVPPDWIEQSTPSLPMTCSTTELRRRRDLHSGPVEARFEPLRLARGPCHTSQVHASLAPPISPLKAPPL